MKQIPNGDREDIVYDLAYLARGIDDDAEKNRIVAAYLDFSKGSPDSFSCKFAVLLKALTFMVANIPLMVRREISAELKGNPGNETKQEPTITPQQFHTLTQAITGSHDKLMQAVQAAQGQGIKASQFDALAAAIKSLPKPEDIEKMLSGGENRELTAFLNEWRVNKAIALSKKEKIKAWVTQISAYVAAALFLVGAGYGLCWVSLHQSVDEKVDRLIGGMPFNTQAQAYLASHHGSVFVGPLQRTQDHPETDGIVINPGNLHLSQSWVSSGGYTVVPIR